TGSHAVLAMEPARCQTALSAIRNGASGDGEASILVDDPQLRPFVRRLVELEFPNLAVLSRPELQPGLDAATGEPIELEEQETARVAPTARTPEQSSSSPHGTAGAKPATDATEPGEIAITVFAGRVVAGGRSDADDRQIDEMFSLMRAGLFYELGVILPEVRL